MFNVTVVQNIIDGNGTAGAYDATLGALFVGVLLSMSLWGVTCVQTSEYFQSDNDDGQLQKLIVALLWLIDTFSSIMDCHLIYISLIARHANPAALVNPPWSTNLHSMVSAISNFIIRTMFARRIYRVSNKSTVIVIWIMLISTCDLVAGILTTVVALHRSATNPLAYIARLLYASFILGLTADLSVTIGLCWLLQAAKSGMRRSDSVVNTLMVYIVNTGLLVGIDTLLALIACIAMPNNMVFYAFVLQLNKLYVNAYLASLNAREKLREWDQEPTLSLSRLGISGRVTQPGDVKVVV